MSSHELVSLTLAPMCIFPHRYNIGHQARDSLPKGKYQYVDLLVQNSKEQLIFKLKPYFLLYTTTYLNEEANYTETSSSISGRDQHLYTKTLLA
jgi:hypothetical protein